MADTRKGGKRSIDRQGYASMVTRAEDLLDAIADGMIMALGMTKERRNSVAGVSDLAHFFYERLNAEWERTQIKDDFLTQGLATAWGKRNGDSGQAIFLGDPRRINETTRPRLVDLLLMYCNEAEDQALRSRQYKKTLIPSPAVIAVSALTAPDDTATEAYALLAVRTALCRRFKVWPVVADEVRDQPSGFEAISESMIVREIGSLKTFVDHRDNYSPTIAIKEFVAHFLAARGFLHLRFENKKSACNWLKVGQLRATNNPGQKARSSGRMSGRPEFRLSDRYPHLPEATSFINEMLGIPLPIRGADTVFFNGLKFSSNVGADSLGVERKLEGKRARKDRAEPPRAGPSTSLVVGVSGGPGTGKTSFALALAAALSPLDTRTVYLTFEEDPKDLRTKLETLSQPRLRRLSFRQGSMDWFIPHRMPGGRLENFEDSVLGALQTQVQGYLDTIHSGDGDRSLAPPIPLLVVVDSVAALWIESSESGDEDVGFCPHGVESIAYRRKRLEAFVDRCRSVGAMVVLLSSSANEFSGVLEYLVDVVITLQVENGANHTQKPLRTFTLSKSRHQMARHGTHVFHLSTEHGFRLAPQLPSQIDARHVLKHQLWDEDVFLDVLNLRRKARGHFERNNFLNVHTRSQILIHGRGSSGKAGLAMKMALAPRCSVNNGIVAGQARSRVLVMSFLYPEEYYENLRKKVMKLQPGEMEESHRCLTGESYSPDMTEWSPKPGYLCFAPGFLADEDLYSKLVRALDGARLEGAPYTVVVIDGLHNLELQFPGARDSTVLWPIMYGTLVRSNVTIISTFTTLSLSQNKTGENRSFDALEVSDFLLRTHLPLLHAMVQASDYVLELSRPSDQDGYNLYVRSAINTEPPRDYLKWDRNNQVFTEQMTSTPVSTTK
ncbi:MAG: hypothetical protein ABIK82_09325 [Pseudomonadota bacterium]